MFTTGKNLTVIVHCRTGSLEKSVALALTVCAVHCRTGSLETSQRAKELGCRVHCRTGSLESYSVSAGK
ncbi:hypothetical protein VCHE48_1894 [Vibrio cholerae HE48]|nr:hypothetical protein VCHE48_1894 [Vibrio cholerae HE48]